MAEELQYDVCPETGIGCVMVSKDSGTLKIDLMPDEVSSLESLVKSGDMTGAKALLASVDSKAETALDDTLLRVLAQEVR